MSDAPIVEKVARAMLDHEWSASNAPGDAKKNADADWSMPQVRAHWIGQARAALSVIRSELLAIIPGGDICDPQEIADAIRTLLGDET